ncbi:F-box/kelch-repeat protein At3g06240-like [Papaver somniferum]|uniref:F-box/kelch-repeat protein At3g06240-like n=1 Tax=Papaver somniferum TaxID=3469 RepID=UPI000E701514|nr:F-box/kelch-repeat protein At3g06240-like [Papaver somniferum]
MHGQTTCGFGYVRSTNEYKVVRIHYIDYEGVEVKVYTLGSGCGWIAIGRVSDVLSGSSGGRGTYANDVIYWILSRKVVAFDLVHEEFRSLCVPCCMHNLRYQDRFGLVVLGRHLCLYIDDIKVRVKIWSLMESTDSETWRMECDIDYKAVRGSGARKLQPILLGKNGEIVLLFAASVLYSYDPKTTFLKMISNKASADYFKHVEASAHINTFASLEATGENSEKYTVRPRQWDDVIEELDRVSLE